MIPAIPLTIDGVTLRLMQPEDLPALHEVLRSNVPDFLPDDPALADNLQEDAPNFFVAEVDGRVVAGGGIDLGATGEQCVLYLGSVHRDFHRRGLGSLLLLARLAWTEGSPGLVWAVVPEPAVAFFERFGFEPLAVPRGRQSAEGFVRLAKWVHPADREEIQGKLRALAIRDLTGPEAGGESERAD